jgi:hypothetical protein
MNVNDINKLLIIKSVLKMWIKKLSEAMQKIYGPAFGLLLMLG